MEPILLDVEMTQKEGPTRWEGLTEEGKRITVTARFWKVRIELDDRLIVTACVPQDHPGTTRNSMTNAGLKQAMMLFPEGWFRLPF